MARLRGFDRVAGRVCGAIVVKEIEVALKIWANACEALLCHISARQYRFKSFFRLDNGESVI